MSPNPRSTVEFLTTSEGRLEVLEGLQEEPLAQSKILEQRSESKKTVQRWLGDLVEWDWIEQHRCLYRPTTLGKVIHRTYKKHESAVTQIGQAPNSEISSGTNFRKDIAFIAGSENRPRVFRALQSQPARQSELVDNLSISRTTIHRCIRDFEEREWVEKAMSSGQYQLTSRGEMLLHTYNELTEASEIIYETEPFLSSLTGDHLEIPLEVLNAGIVAVASPDEPHAAVVDFLQNLRFEETAHFRSMTPVVSQVYNKEIEAYLGSDIQMELIIDKPVLEASKSKNLDGLETAIETENIELYLHPGRVSFGLGIFNDEMAMMGAFDEDGNHRAGLVGEDDTVVDWMVDVYDMYKQEAKQLTEIPEEVAQ